MSEIFRVGFVNRWERRDPRTGLNYSSFLVQWHIYQPPYHLTPGSNQVKAALLEIPLQREPDDGGLVYSARACSGVHFSDGTRLTADHVAASLEKTPAFKAQASASARGDRVFFRLKRPNARFELLLARFDLGIVLERGNELLGTGPYMLAPDPQPEGFRLVCNPHAKDAPRLPEIECRVYPLDPDGRRKQLLEAVNRGEVDFTDELTREEVNHVERMRKCIDLGYCTAVLFFNTEKPLFQESRVRTAFASAIDRKNLAAQSYSNALAFAATGLIPPVLGSAPDFMMHDLARAKDLLAAAQARSASPLTLAVLPVPRPYLPEPRATAELIAAQLGDIGFPVQMKHPRDLTEYQDICQRGDYDLLLAGWIPDTSDPVDFMESLLASNTIPSSSNQATRGSNLSRWRNNAMDEALQKQRMKPEPANWQRICELVRNEAPLVPLMYGPRIAVVSWRAKNFPRDFGSGPFLAQVELPDSAFAAAGVDARRVSKAI
jgi:ABC-type transport system substrate-binding protein